MFENKKISERAQRVFNWMKNMCENQPSPVIPALSRNPEIPHQVRDDKSLSPEIWIRQATIAEQFGCSRSSICKAVKELREAGYVKDLNKRHEGKYKFYEVVQEPSPDFAEAKSPSPKRRGEKEIDQIWQEYGEIWKKQFPYMDGQSGRPLLEEFVPRFSKRLLDLNPNSNKTLMQRLKPNLSHVARLAAINYAKEYGHHLFFEIVRSEQALS